MGRRFEGFVVGKQTVRQQKGWKIGRRTRKGKLNYFAPETEVVEGFEVFAAAEVTFSTETRDGRSYALNVQPKPQQMEDSMRKIALGLIVTFILAVVALAAIVKPHHYEPLRGLIVEIRAEWALDSIRKLTAGQIITDRVVRAAVRNGHNLRAASASAREAVFQEHQCHIFSSWGDPNEACFTARYSEGRIKNNVWYEEIGLPVSIAPTIAKMRTALYRIGRSYLADPANLRAVHTAKVDVVLDEYDMLSAERRQALRELLADAITAFEQFRADEAVRELYEEYIEREQVWLGALFAGDDYYELWLKGVEAENRLREAVKDLPLYLFAGRRYSEGGDELLNAYLEIMRDLQNRLNNNG